MGKCNLALVTCQEIIYVYSMVLERGVEEGCLSTALCQEVFAKNWISTLDIYTRQIFTSVDSLKYGRIC